MNKKKFYKQLEIGKAHSNITNNTIREFLNAKNTFFGNANTFDLIKANFEDIIRFRSKGEMEAIIQELYKYPEMYNFLNSKVEFILASCESYELLNFFVYSDKLGVNYVNYINENMLDLMSELSDELLSDLYASKYIKEENKKMIVEKFRGNEVLLLQKLFRVPVEKKNSKEDVIKLYKLTKMVIDEVLESEGLGYQDIHVIGVGYYSTVLEVGSKVVKIGLIRHNYEIPNDERLLQPIMRIDTSRFSTIKATIEVTEKVEVNFAMTEDELFAIYKEMRSRGIVPTDFRKDNLGVLIKDNRLHWNKKISPDMETRGFYGEIERVLGPGEIVIIDSDFVIRENELNEATYWPSNTAFKFEDRYQLELHPEKAEEINYAYREILYNNR